MKSSNAGEPTTAAEVVQVSKHGFWINVDGEEFFLPFERYPWFENAILHDVFNVQFLHGFHLRWPDLDVDLELDALRHPENYPLQFPPMMRKYVVVIEKGPTSVGAYVPDLPGCVAAGKTIVEVERLIREAIESHIERLRADGAAIPAPVSIVREVEVYGR